MTLYIQLKSIKELDELSNLIRIGLFNADASADTEIIELAIGDFEVPVEMVVTRHLSHTPEYSGWSEAAIFSLSFASVSFKYYGQAEYSDDLENPEQSGTFFGFVAEVEKVVSNWVRLYKEALEAGKEKIG